MYVQFVQQTQNVAETEKHIEQKKVNFGENGKFFDTKNFLGSVTVAEPCGMGKSCHSLGGVSVQKTEDAWQWGRIR